MEVKIVAGENHADLSENLNVWLNKGYELYGYPFVWRGFLLQMIVKKEN